MTPDEKRQRNTENKRKWRLANPDKVAAAEARRKTPEFRAKVREYRKEWYHRPEVKERMLKKQKAYDDKRWEEDSEYRERRRQKRAEVFARNREFVRAIKRTTPCADCGGHFHPVCMDFHHVSDKKVQNIARLTTSAAMKTLAAEIAKCIVICSNCHRIRTWVTFREEGIDIEEACA